MADAKAEGVENRVPAGESRPMDTIAPNSSSELAVWMVKQQMEIMQRQLYLISKSRGN
jgi:hypothetical protein